MKTMNATIFSNLPTALHHSGAPSAWAAMTRPGEQMHSFLEGPVFDDKGNLWLTDVPYGRIFQVAPDGAWSLIFSYDGEPHSIRPMPDGRYAIVDYSKGLLAFDPEHLVIEALAENDNGQPFLGLSDLTLSPEGDIWFTDSGRTSLSDPSGRLYCRRHNGTVERVLEMIPYPNGVVSSPDGKFIYIAVTRTNAIWRLKSNGVEVPPMVGLYIQLSGGLGPDGLAMSSKGYLAAAHAQAGRAYVFDLLGNAIAEIRTPHGSSTTGVTFDQNDDLYITEASQASIYKVPYNDWMS